MNEQQVYQELAERLRRRIASSPKRSYTAKQAQQQLQSLEESENLTIAEKIAAVRDTLREYQIGLDYTDSQLEHPGERRPYE